MFKLVHFSQGVCEHTVVRLCMYYVVLLASLLSAQQEHLALTAVFWVKSSCILCWPTGEFSKLMLVKVLL